MAESKRDPATSEQHEIAGHAVEIRRSGDREELRIDGRRRRFFVNRHGYRLYDNAYVPPTKTLLEAVRAYLLRGSRTA